MQKVGGLFIFTTVLATVLLFLLSKLSLGFTDVWSLVWLSQISSLIGTTLLSWGFILAARTKIIERLFGGLDRVYQAHHLVSAVAYLLLLEHPFLLIVSRLPNISSALTLIIPGTNIAYTAGILALLILTGLIIFTLFVDLPYHVWKRTHEFMGLALLFAAIHVYLIPSDISRYLPLRIFMLTQIAIALFSVIYKQLLYKLVNPSREFILKDIRHFGDIAELTLNPIEKMLSFDPGQFVFAQFSLLPYAEAHPFSITSVPDDPDIKLAVKIVGDGTLKIRDLQPGSSVTLSSPFGMFGERFWTRRPVVCVAGGIGITPFLSLLSYAARRRAHSQVKLFYTVPNIDEAYGNELINNISRDWPEFTFHLHPSRSLGRLTGKMISDLIPELKNALVFLCGPQPMMLGLKDQLVGLGLRRSQIIFEDFKFK